MGIVVPNPYPLRTCPALPGWLKYTGQEYLIFIDESFSMFFELTKERGYFCHGGVGIPALEYDAVQAEVAPIFNEYRRLLVSELKEFKNADFKRLPFPDRKRLAKAIHDVLQPRGGFVMGFYTPVRSFILERVRTEVMDTHPSVPADHKKLYEEEIEQVRAQWDGPGNSDVIAQLLLLPASGFSHMMAGLKCTFRIIYDPRGPKEDKAVFGRVDGLTKAIKRMSPSVEDRYLGMDYSRPSEEVLGLQLADLAAGQTRDFLDANQDLQTYGATPRIITQGSDEPFMAIEEMMGRVFKTGAIVKMPNALQSRFFKDDPKGRSVLPQFTDIMASGMLTCYSTWGTPRHLIVYDKLILDQTDK